MSNTTQRQAIRRAQWNFEDRQKGYTVFKGTKPQYIRLEPELSLRESLEILAGFAIAGIIVAVLLAL